MRKTKIIATLGPATESPEMIGQLIDAGMNIARLNMSHAQHDWARKVVNEVRKAARLRERHVAILMDTQGPAIRTGDLPAAIDLKPGDKFTFTMGPHKAEEGPAVDVNYDNVVNDLNVGNVVLIDNGEIQMRVVAKDASRVVCHVLTPGKLGSRRHINLPGVKVGLPALTAKDLKDIDLGLELGVDYVALSFVREAKDIQQLRAILERSERPPLIIAKIEDQQAVKNVDGIIHQSNGVMVARGDLGVECPYEELPIIQRRIVKTCLRVGRPVIVATHMLESMVHNPLPTRAEVTDVANAVFEQSDAIMLSGETSVGRYPLRCIEVFDTIARRIERSGGANYQEQAELETARQKLVKSAVVMANELKAEAILVFTIHGSMARYAAWMRPRYSPIYAFCPSEDLARALSLHWGVRSVVTPFDQVDPDKTITAALRVLRDKSLVHPGGTVVIIGAIAASEKIVDAVQMRVVD